MIEELNNGVKQASDELKEATKPSNLVKSIREQDTRLFEVIEDKEAFLKDLNKNLEANATPLPKGMSVEAFKKSLESVENKERFLEHLKTRANSDERLAALNLVEPIIREPHIEIFTKDKGINKKEYIKAFKDENQSRLYMLITQDNDTILRTFIPNTPERYVRNHVKLKESIKARQNHTETLKNALNQKEQAKNPIEQQRQTLEKERNEKEQQKRNQEHEKWNKEQQKQAINNEINAIGNERLTFKQLGTQENFLGISEYFNDNGRGRTYAKAVFSDKTKSIREYYELETKIKNILGFYRIGQSEERILKRFLELNPSKQHELGQKK
nr:hypothetical protein [Helicobacter pylori]